MDTLCAVLLALWAAFVLFLIVTNIDSEAPTYTCAEVRYVVGPGACTEG